MWARTAAASASSIGMRPKSAMVSRCSSRAGGLDPAPAGDVDEHPCDHRHGDEDDQRHQVVAPADRQGVVRRHVEPVDQQERRQGRGRRARGRAGDGDHDHREQVEQQDRLQRERVPPGVQDGGERRQDHGSRQQAGRRAARPVAEPAAELIRVLSVTLPINVPITHAPTVPACAPLAPTRRAARFGRRPGGRRLRAGAPLACAVLRRPSPRRWAGTLVTNTPGRNSRRVFSRSALWLCSRCSHQCADDVLGHEHTDHVVRARVAPPLVDVLQHGAGDVPVGRLEHDERNRDVALLPLVQKGAPSRRGRPRR